MTVKCPRDLPSLWGFATASMADPRGYNIKYGSGGSASPPPTPLPAASPHPHCQPTSGCWLLPPPPHPSSASGTSHRGMVLMCGSATEDALVEFIKEHAATISLFRVTTTIPVLQRVRHLLGRNGDAAVSALPPLCCLCPLSASLIAAPCSRTPQ